MPIWLAAKAVVRVLADSTLAVVTLLTVGPRISVGSLSQLDRHSH